MQIFPWGPILQSWVGAWWGAEDFSKLREITSKTTSLETWDRLLEFWVNEKDGIGTDRRGLLANTNDSYHKGGEGRYCIIIRFNRTRHISTILGDILLISELIQMLIYQLLTHKLGILRIQSSSFLLLHWLYSRYVWGIYAFCRPQ